ncbi:MAG: YbaK/EbsC family protein [Pseudomonadota bacterium]
MGEVKATGSVARVEQAAHDAGLAITIVRMPSSTRTADDAAAACGCTPAQIVKSMIFETMDTKRLILLLVSGAHNANLKKVATIVGEDLKRSDPNRVRTETGFAIGGVSPLGHLTPLPVWIDATLLTFDRVWAAAGAPDSVFEVAPAALVAATGAQPADLA